MGNRFTSCCDIYLLLYVIVSGCFLTGGLSAEELVIPADSDEEIILIDADETVISDEIIIVDDEPATSGDEVIVIEEPANESNEILIDDGSPDDEVFIDNSGSSLADTEGGQSNSVITLEDVWLEAAALVKDDQPVNALYYGHATVSAEWDIDSSWEVKATARVDGYRQTGSPDWNDVDFDYGDTYVRYRGENTRVTLGAQKVIWGRIDEVPPTDRLSTVDARRLVLDDLPDRRLARPLLRVETFIDNGKLDFLYLPTFREAELADRDSIWYPIDRSRGKVLGIKVDPAIAAVMPNSTIINDEPDSDDAVGSAL